MKKYLWSTLYTMAMILFAFKSQSQVTVVPSPSGSENFGNSVIVLSNGNYVIGDPKYDQDGISDIGAVFLYDGHTHQLISKLTGSTANDQVSIGGVKSLPNGNFIVSSYYWNNGSKTKSGAVTWINGITGLNGVVNSTNSLIGGSADDQVGISGISIVGNGNYLVRSRNWHNGLAAFAGAATWGNADSGIAGVVSAANSLVGTSANDYVGNTVELLSSSGNYVVLSPNWDNLAEADAGALTWGNGTVGVYGSVNSGNSLVGTLTNDRIGVGDLTELPNGNFIVRSPDWNNGSRLKAGAISWVNGETGVNGVVSSSNSLVGSSTWDRVGDKDIVILNNSNFLVHTNNWDNGNIVDAGAVTWGSGDLGVTGIISSSNSLVGSRLNDKVGEYATLVLSNGNFVVKSPSWDNGDLVDAGAATWGSGTAGISGTINTSNSTVGTSNLDGVGSYIVALTNGNYVIACSNWDNGFVKNAGAVTWGDGSAGTFGEVNTNNSIVGSSSNDQVGGQGVVALSNGNYVIVSTYWANGDLTQAGAVTWCDGTLPTIETVNTSNSLVGSNLTERIGDGGITVLTNGNYIVSSQYWRTGNTVSRGAITWGDGESGVIGTVSGQNSLIGGQDEDHVGNIGVTALSNGDYVVISSLWDKETIENVGAVTYCDGAVGAFGLVTDTNSLTGTSLNDNIGSKGITLLPNGNYLIKSPYWKNVTLTAAGAVTWCKENTPLAGNISGSNSLVGSTAHSLIGNGSVVILSNGNYVVVNNKWATWGDGNIGIVGPVTTLNSLETSGGNNIIANGLLDGNYIVWNSYRNPTTYSSKFISTTLCNGITGTSGAVNSCNSIMGGGKTHYPDNAYSLENGYFVVGQFAENTVSVFDPIGSPLSSSLDESFINIAGEGRSELKINSGCRLLATLESQGSNAVTGSVNAKVWVENQIPTFGGEPFLARHYQITPEYNSENATGKVTLFFSQDEFDNFNLDPNSTLNLPTNGSDTEGIANLRISKFSGISYDGSGLPGSYSQEHSRVLDPIDNDIVWNANLSRWEVTFNVTGFSGFFVHTNTTPLPVKLISFNGKKQENSVSLQWTIADAENFSHFQVQRSQDAKSFETFGTVDYLESKQLFELTDREASSEVNDDNTVYYRLKMVDIDQTFAYSRIVSISFPETKIEVYPNPTADKIFFAIDMQAQISSVKIMNIVGTLVYENNTIPQNGIDISHLAPGLYTVQLRTADGTSRRSKVVVTK